MKTGGGTLLTLAIFFATTSLFAIGGANSAVPEIHRFTVEVQHLAEHGVQAAGLTPGPNIIIVTLIGYHVAGVAGGLVTTLAIVPRTDLRVRTISCRLPRLRSFQRQDLAQRRSAAA